MVESGELDKIRRKWASPEQECGGGKGRPLGFENTSPAFLVYLAGLISCWVVLCFEVWISRRNRGISREKLFTKENESKLKS